VCRRELGTVVCGAAPAVPVPPFAAVVDAAVVVAPLDAAVVVVAPADAAVAAAPSDAAVVVAPSDAAVVAAPSGAAVVVAPTDAAVVVASDAAVVVIPVPGSQHQALVHTAFGQPQPIPLRTKPGSQSELVQQAIPKYALQTRIT